MIPVSSLELAGLFLFLKAHENELDTVLTQFLRRTEQNLYELLSIEEIEELPTLYGRNIDVIKEKG